MANYIMGVDPALLNTGICILDIDTMKPVYFTVIKNITGSHKQYSTTPYEKIMNGIDALIGEWKPQWIFLEKMFQSKSSDVSEMLFGASLCVRLAASKRGIGYRVIPINGRGATQGWRTYILRGTEKGQSKMLRKQATRNLLRKELSIDKMNEHEGDALAIALTGWYLQTGVDYRTVHGIQPPGDFSEYNPVS